MVCNNSMFCLLYLKNITINDVIKSFFPISNGGYWWFLKAYFIIYLISPILEDGIRTITKKKFQIILFIYACVIYIGSFIGLSLGTSIYNLLLVYLLGRYMAMYPFLLLDKINYKTFLCILFFFLSLVSLFYWKSYDEGLRLLLSNCDFLVLLMAISLVLFCNRFLWSNRNINYILKGVFSIYLITDNVNFRDYVMVDLLNIFNSSIEVTIFKVNVLIGVCLLLELIRKLLYNNIDIKVSHFIERKIGL